MFGFLRKLFFTDEPFGDGSVRQGSVSLNKAAASGDGMSLRRRSLITILLSTIILITSYLVVKKSFLHVDVLEIIPIFVTLAIVISFSTEKPKKGSIARLFLGCLFSITYLFADLFIVAGNNGCTDTCGLGAVLFAVAIVLYFVVALIWRIVRDIVRGER